MPPVSPQPDSPPPTNPHYLAPDVLDLLGIQPSDIPDGRSKGGININIVNNNNYGDGTITTGDINQGNTYNIFNIGSINIDMSGLIYDLDKGSDRINGTTNDDVLAVGPGKDKVKGGDGADQFIFSIKADLTCTQPYVWIQVTNGLDMASIRGPYGVPAGADYRLE